MKFVCLGSGYRDYTHLLSNKLKVLSFSLSSVFIISSQTHNKSASIFDSFKENVRRKENPIPPMASKQVKFFNSLAPAMLAAILALSPICSTPVSSGQTIDIQRGAKLFRQTCIGCHDAGGNIIQPGATLYTKDLQRNGVDTVEEIYRVTYYGKGRMPGFGQECMPRGQCTFGARLEDEEIKILAEFVKLQADQGWPSIKAEED